MGRWMMLMVDAGLVLRVWKSKDLFLTLSSRILNFYANLTLKETNL